MSRKQYRYDPKTLSYEEMNISVGKRSLRLLAWIIPNLIIGFLLAVFFLNRTESPREVALREELETVNSELLKIKNTVDFSNRALEAIEKRDEEMYRLSLHAEAFPEELRRMGTGGSEKYAHLLVLPNGELLAETTKEIDALNRRLYAQSLSFDELSELIKNKDELLKSIPSIQPVNNKKLRKAISGFGYRIDPIYRTRRMHSGMDFTAAKGTDVYVTADGVVEKVLVKRWGYGKHIVVNHGNGYKTLYAHLSAFKVKKGQRVKRGELIGLIGSTGKSTGPHLHYEVIKEGKKVNPIGYFHSDLTPEQYEELIKQSNNSFEALD